MWGGGTTDVASRPFIFDLNGKKIGVYAFAEHEFSIVTDTHVGANPFDPLESPDRVEELKRHCDYVIVLYHGGKEHYRYPSPSLRKTFRKLADKGADIVIAQHTHCIGCEEKYKNATLVYGQGNFIFSYRDCDEWRTSLLIQLDDCFSVSYVPIVKKDNVVRMADEETAKKILSDFKQRSNEIMNDGFVEEKYTQFSQEMLDKYLNAFSGKKGVFFRVLNRVSNNRLQKKYLDSHYSTEKLLSIQNYVECESHRELLIDAIKTKVILNR